MKRHINAICFLIAFMSAVCSSGILASQVKFSITPASGSMTSLLLPANFTETVRYEVTNQTTITRTLTMVPLPGVSQTVVGTGVCASPFTLAPQETCTLVLVVDGSQIPSTGIMSGPVICKTKGPNDFSPDPLLCSQPSTADILAVASTTAGQHAYIANQNGNSISFCQANPATGVLTNCAVTATGLGAPEGIGFHPGGKFFYAANPSTSSITVCTVSQTSGALSNCIDSGGTGFNLPDAIAFSADGTILYTSNFAGSEGVSACLVNATTGMLSSCVNNASATFSAAADMAVNAAGTFAYVVNRTANTTSVCSVSGQTVSSCNNLSGSLFDGPEGITLDPSGLHAFIANAGGANIVVCDIRQDGTGLLKNCVVTGGQFDGTGNIGLNDEGAFAYVPNQATSKVFLCKVTHNSGELSECSLSLGTGFDGPAGIVLR